ncbi:MAG: hypothetical protein ACP5FH_06335, partial [Terracidiphilus sp.]
PRTSQDDTAHEAGSEQARELPERAAQMDASLTSGVVYADDIDSSARLIPTPATSAAAARSVAVLPSRAISKSPPCIPMDLVAALPQSRPAEAAVEETPSRSASRNWHAAAWERERERERELRAGDHRANQNARRRLGS